MKKSLFMFPIAFGIVALAGCNKDIYYTVRFDTDGGTEIADVKVKKNQTVARPAENPTKENWIFNDWMTTKDGTEAFNFADTKITADTTIYAYWAAPKTKLTFNLNTEKEEYKEYIADAPDSQEIPYDKCAHMPTPPHTSEGSWQFAGWYENDSCTGNSFDFSTQLKTKGDKTLYANWVQNKTVAIFIYSNDYYDYVLTEPGTKIAQPENPTYHGYTFKGWYSDETFDTPYDFNKEVPAGTVSVRIYAKWERTKYTVHFDLNGGTGDIDDQKVIYEHKVTRPSITPTKEGYHFNNWFKDKELTTLFDFNNEIVTDNLTIYAGYSVNEYTVTFVTNGGSPIEPIHITSEQILIKPEDPTYLGKKFVNWYKDPEFKGEPFNGWDNKINKSFTLYAKWEVKEYTVTFMNGTTKHEEATVKHGGFVNKPSKDPIGSGTFVAWYTEDTCDNAFDFGTPITKNTTLYAGFGHTVTFDTTGVSEETFNSQVILNNKFAVYPGVPTKLKTPGLNCYGWKIKDTEEDFNFKTTPIISDITLVPATVSNVITILCPKNLEIGQTYDIKVQIGDLVLETDNVTWILDDEGSKLINIQQRKLTVNKDTNGGTAYITAQLYYKEQWYKGSIRVEVGSFASLKKDELQNGVACATSSAVSGTIVIPGYYCYENEWIEIKTIKNHGFCDCNGIKKVVIPETITEIGDSAFSCFTRQSSQYGGYDPTGNITSIVFKGTSRLERIGVEAFDGQKELTSITIPASVKEIGAGAFLDNQKLSSVHFEDAKGPWDIIASSVSETQSRTNIDLSIYTQTELSYGLTRYSWNDSQYGLSDFTWKKSA